MGLIDATVFCDLLDKHSKIYGGEEEKISNLLKSLIEKAPTVDAEPVVHAHWVKTKVIKHDILGFKEAVSAYGCSHCKSASRHYRKDFRRCPNCGAIMDEEVLDDRT